ncbi:MFS transporter [Streptomyces sp. NPDC001393]
MAQRGFHLPVAAVAVGALAVVTSEMAPVGLLSAIADGLHVRTGTAGFAMTAPGVVAAVTALVLALVRVRADRRTLLLGAVGTLGAANLVVALAPNFAVLLLARVVTGFAIGVFWSLALGLGPRLAPSRAVARATTLILGGVQAAAVAGVPAVAFVGRFASWRTAFLMLAAAALAVGVALTVLLPRLPAVPAASGGSPRTMLRGRPLLWAVAALFLAMLGHFAAYTYVTPALRGPAGIASAWIGTLLAIYGVAGLTANFLLVPVVSRWRKTYATAATLLVIAGAPLLFAALAHGTTTAAVLVTVWGIGYGAGPALLTLDVLRAAPGAEETAGALCTFSFNLAVATGAALGGVVVDASSVPSTLFTGGLIVILAVLVSIRACSAIARESKVAAPAQA